MKVRIKNNRLALEGRILNLSEASDADLRKVAAKFQIGWQTFVTKEMPVVIGGVTKMRNEQVVEPKSRKQLEDEIRRALTITFYIPKEYWTSEQAEAFNSYNLIEEKDISREEQVKKEYRIMQVLPPYEETKDKIKEASMLAEVTDNQWEYLKQAFNKRVKREKDDEGRTIGKKQSYVNRLVVVEEIPENDEEAAAIKEKEDGKKDKS